MLPLILCVSSTFCRFFFASSCALRSGGWYCENRILQLGIMVIIGATAVKCKWISKIRILPTASHH